MASTPKFLTALVKTANLSLGRLKMPFANFHSGGVCLLRWVEGDEYSSCNLCNRFRHPFPAFRGDVKAKNGIGVACILWKGELIFPHLKTLQILYKTIYIVDRAV